MKTKQSRKRLRRQMKRKKKWKNPVRHKRIARLRLMELMKSFKWKYTVRIFVSFCCWYFLFFVLRSVFSHSHCCHFSFYTVFLLFISLNKYYLSQSAPFDLAFLVDRFVGFCCLAVMYARARARVVFVISVCGCFRQNIRR